MISLRDGFSGTFSKVQKEIDFFIKGISTKIVNFEMPLCM
jgi:hypothetical protein